MSSSPTAAQAIDLSVRVGNVLRAKTGEVKKGRGVKKGRVHDLDVHLFVDWFPDPEEYREALRLYQMSKGWSGRKGIDDARVVQRGDYNPLPFELLWQEEVEEAEAVSEENDKQEPELEPEFNLNTYAF